MPILWATRRFGIDGNCKRGSIITVPIGMRGLLSGIESATKAQTTNAKTSGMQPDAHAQPNIYHKGTDS